MDESELPTGGDVQRVPGEAVAWVSGFKDGVYELTIKAKFHPTGKRSSGGKSRVHGMLRCREILVKGTDGKVSNVKGKNGKPLEIMGNVLELGEKLARVADPDSLPEIAL